MMGSLAADHGEKKTMMIDAIYVKTHRSISLSPPGILPNTSECALLDSIPDDDRLIRDRSHDADSGIAPSSLTVEKCKATVLYDKRR